MDYNDFLEKKSEIHHSHGHKCLADLSAAFHYQRPCVEWACEKGRAALFQDTGLGKAQSVYDKILTPNGWIKIGDSRVGDDIFGSDGKIYKITGVFPQGKRDLYEFKFSDNSIVNCDHDHLWAVYSQSQRYKLRKYSVRTAEEIKNIGIEYKDGGKKHFLPIIEPLVFPESLPLEIDPYTLGVILGDGSIISGCPLITTPDVEIIDNILLPEGCRVIKNNTPEGKCCSYSITGGEYRNSLNPVTESLRRLKLLGNKSESKFIPGQYKRASIKNRLSILQGLLDTDGYTSGSCIEFSSASMEMASDVVFIVRSLGGTATEPTDEKAHYTKAGKRFESLNKHRTIIKLPSMFDPFRLKRKRQKHNPIQRKNPFKNIVGIKEIGKHDAVCISVSAPDKLYITNGFTLTHNTVQQLLWSDSVVKKTDGKVLILAPLSVTSQTVKEGEKFGISVNRCRENDEVKQGINITNYEILSHFDCSQFDGVVLDESSCLKSFTSVTRNALVENFRNTSYRLACSATPAPNDMMEIGNHAEFLGVMSRTEMLATFFVHDGGETSKWRLKGHAPKAFWKWMSSWALMMRNPSDIGFSNSGFELPKLNIYYHFVDFGNPDNGELFKTMAVGMNEQRAVRRDSIDCRMKKALEIINDEQWLIWCDLNDESKQLSKSIPNSVEITGADKPEKKEKAIEDFINGDVINLISKGKIFGFGLNLQHCHNMMFFGLSHSYELMYQSIRRCWRYGQKHPVNVHIIITDIERPIVENIHRKHEQAEQMSKEMVKQMADFTKNDINKTIRQTSEYKATSSFKMPKFI